MLRAELAFRTAAAHGCQPAAAGRYWAVFGLLTDLTPAEQSGRPGVLTRLRRPLHESEEAATTRFGDLVADLVTWAKAQYTTAPAGQQQRTPRQEAAALPPKPTAPPRTTAGLPHPGVAVPPPRTLPLLWPPSQGQPTPLPPDPALTRRTTPCPRGCRRRRYQPPHPFQGVRLYGP